MQSDLRILLVHHDAQLCEQISEYTAGWGVSIDSVTDSTTGLARLRRGAYDAVVLEVPTEVELSSLGTIRSLCGVPLIAISLQADKPDWVAELETAADDYLSIPFSSRELLMRMQALQAADHEFREVGSQ